MKESKERMKESKERNGDGREIVTHSIGRARTDSSTISRTMNIGRVSLSRDEMVPDSFGWIGGCVITVTYANRV